MSAWGIFGLSDRISCVLGVIRPDQELPLSGSLTWNFTHSVFRPMKHWSSGAQSSQHILSIHTSQITQHANRPTGSSHTTKVGDEWSPAYVSFYGVDYLRIYRRKYSTRKCMKNCSKACDVSNLSFLATPLICIRRPFFDKWFFFRERSCIRR